MGNCCSTQKAVAEKPDDDYFLSEDAVEPTPADQHHRPRHPSLFAAGDDEPTLGMTDELNQSNSSTLPSTSMDHSVMGNVSTSSPRASLSSTVGEHASPEDDRWPAPRVPNGRSASMDITTSMSTHGSPNSAYDLLPLNHRRKTVAATIASCNPQHLARGADALDLDWTDTDPPDGVVEHASLNSTARDMAPLSPHRRQTVAATIASGNPLAAAPSQPFPQPHAFPPSFPMPQFDDLSDLDSIDPEYAEKLTERVMKIPALSRSERRVLIETWMQDCTVDSCNFDH